MFDSLAEVMTEKGYVATTVSDVIERAGVSRETFYQQFDSKRDCFEQAFDEAAQPHFSELSGRKARSGLRSSASSAFWAGTWQCSLPTGDSRVSF